MLACIACSKDGAEDTARADTPRNKSLSSQIKDMVLKFAGSARHCKDGTAPSSTAFAYSNKNRYRGHCSDVGNDTGYVGGSSSSTPAWDFASIVRPEVGAFNKIREEEEEDEVAKEWTAVVEPGVQITFMSLPGGSRNDLRRIRFSRDMFDKLQAQRWWAENFDRVMELYNVQSFSQQPLQTPPRPDAVAEEESLHSPVAFSMRESPATPPFARTNINTTRPPTATSSRAGGGGCTLPIQGENSNAAATTIGIGNRGGNSPFDPSRTTTSSRGEAPSISVSDASETGVTEWVEQDEPGVYVTIREQPDGTRELRRVRFSREMFGEVHAKVWWECNRERIQAQYL